MTEPNPADVQDIVRRLDLAMLRLGHESQDEATVRRNQTIVDAKAEIERLRAALQQSRSAVIEECAARVENMGTSHDSHAGERFAEAIRALAVQQ